MTPLPTARVLFVVLLTGLTAPAAPVPKPRGPSEAEIDAGLAEAHGHLQAQVAGGDDAGKRAEQFRAALQKIAPGLPAVVPVEGEPEKYTQRTLNARKKKLDALRFTTPPGKANWDLRWEFVVAEPFGFNSWYILPREGTMNGFRTFQSMRNHEEPGAGLPAVNRRVVQSLDGGALKPGADYVLWFAFEDEDAADFHVRIGLTPAKAAK